MPQHHLFSAKVEPKMSLLEPAIKAFPTTTTDATDKDGKQKKKYVKCKEKF